MTLSFAGSSDLATQISQGAPADVFASADASTMAKLGSAGPGGRITRDFASNVLTIAVPGNRPCIATFADLSNRGQDGMSAAQVPCGAASKDLEQAKPAPRLQPVSEESSVTDVLGKVVSGEADAGLVYVTDVQAAGDKVQEIPFPESARAVNTYPMAVGPAAMTSPPPSSRPSWAPRASSSSAAPASEPPRPT